MFLIDLSKPAIATQTEPGDLTLNKNSPVTVLITGAIDKDAISELSSNPDLLVIDDSCLPRKKWFSKLSEVQVLITRSETVVDKELLDLAPKLKIIARAAVGVSNIDIDYATQRGILILNTPGKNTNSAAEFTLGLLISLARKMNDAHIHLKSGKWDRSRFVGTELRGKKIGLVGLGNVGHRVAKFAHGLDMIPYAYDPYIGAELFNRYGVKKCSSLDELASNIEILSVHTPLNEETKGIVDMKFLLKMARGGMVVNAARGGLVVEEDLLECLNTEHISGAALDTWVDEPSPNTNLVNHPNVYCTPHLGASTREAQREIGKTVVSQIEKALSGGVVDYPINLPKIGTIDDPLVKPYAILAEKLGVLAAQIASTNLRRIEVMYRGDLAGSEHSLIRLGWMKGYISQAVDSYVSYVNAKHHFESLGLKLDESIDPGYQGYQSAITFFLRDDTGATFSIGGIVFDQKILRLSLINDYFFEVEPAGHFLLIANADRPGVVGNIGSFLADNHLNIDSFDLSRNKKGGQAMALIKVDTKVSQKLVASLYEIENISNCWSFSL